jgi:hypothetical protein
MMRIPPFKADSERELWFKQTHYFLVEHGQVVLRYSVILCNLTREHACTSTKVIAVTINEAGFTVVQNFNHKIVSEFSVKVIQYRISTAQITKKGLKNLRIFLIIAKFFIYIWLLLCI